MIMTSPPPVGRYPDFYDDSVVTDVVGTNGPNEMSFDLPVFDDGIILAVEFLYLPTIHMSRYGTR